MTAKKTKTKQKKPFIIYQNYTQQNTVFKGRKPWIHTASPPPFDGESLAKQSGNKYWLSSVTQECLSYVTSTVYMWPGLKQFNGCEPPSLPWVWDHSFMKTLKYLIIGN